MTRQFDALRGVGQLAAFHVQDPKVPIHEVAHIQVLPVGAERHGLGKPADIDLSDVGDLLAVDLERGDRAGRMMEKGGLGMFEPLASTATARSPFGLIARPSGESPTVT